jgi:hypothetical protein
MRAEKREEKWHLIIERNKNEIDRVAHSRKFPPKQYTLQNATQLRTCLLAISKMLESRKQCPFW